MYYIFIICFICFVLGRETPSQRAHNLLLKMTLKEKIGMVHGYDSRNTYVGVVRAVPRLKIPTLNLQDGPQGVGDGVDGVTCFPSALTAVASWDRHWMERFSAAQAREELLKGANIWLGPMVNIARVPWGGRNFESYGEDPFLAAELVRHSIRGAQKEGVIATVKHFVDNNQEYNRTTVSENVGMRAQFEIYYPAFKSAVDAGVGAVMCSYNLVNNTYACENNETLNRDLKGRMGFQGFVMSDWGGTHSTVKAANNGLDMQMPDDSYFGEPLERAVNSGAVPLSRLNDMVVRILTSMFSVGLFDRAPVGNITANVTTRQHAELTRKIAEAGTVLLKNNPPLLPLSTSYRNVAIIGDDGFADPLATGDGSGRVNCPYIVTPLDAIKKRLPNSKVVYARTQPIVNAMKAAKEADIAIVFVSVTSSEGHDRQNLSLPFLQDDLISQVRSVQKNVVVVLHIAGAVTMPWANDIPSIVSAFLPGQEDGNSIASVLFGDYNPSGKLPITFPMSDSQTPLKTRSQYPGILDQANYTEGLNVGYRWYDQFDETPLFPFGHGLSYTYFNYSDLTIENKKVITIGMNIQNAGMIAGREVVQLYVGFPKSANEPPKQLKGFEIAHLKKGESKKLTFHLTKESLSIFDVDIQNWRFISGNYNIYIGSSSRDIRLHGSFALSA